MKTYKKNKSAIIISLVLLIMAITYFNPVQAKTLPNGEIEGIWQGVIKSSGIELRIVFTISRNPDNTLTATMDVPEQNATGIPIDKVIFDGNNVRLEIISIEGVFTGKLTEDGETINGQWSQSGLLLPLVLEHADMKPVIKRPQEPKEPLPYRVEEVNFKNNDANITLAGTLTFPHSEGTFPAVLLLSGSGLQDRDEASQEKTKGKSDFPVLTGRYLGQKPPGLIPEIFAPGIVSKSDYHEHSSPTFSSNGKEVYWSAQCMYEGESNQRIFFMEFEDGKWTPPEILNFTKIFHGGGPIFSLDEKRLYFYSCRPKPFKERFDNLHIWYMDKTDTGWGELIKMSQPINSEKSESNPTFTPEGTMYFDSRREGGKGKADIYRSQFINPNIKHQGFLIEHQ